VEEELRELSDRESGVNTDEAEEEVFICSVLDGGLAKSLGCELVLVLL
jgi:hypothetical protein